MKKLKVDDTTVGYSASCVYRILRKDGYYPPDTIIETLLALTTETLQYYKRKTIRKLRGI